MKTLYIECNMGAAGDMLMGALYELLEDKEGFLKTMNHLLPGVEVTAREAMTCGVRGTHMQVSINEQEEESQEGVHGSVHSHGFEGQHNHIHTHTSFQEVERILEEVDLPSKVKEDACNVYHRIAQAESRVHGVSVSEIHFHEVGNLDAIADVTGVCLALYLLRPERIYASPIHLGMGQVSCAHGIVPAPAPATVHLLQGIPCYGGSIPGELCTPTGAALVSYFAEKFGPMPLMRLSGCGYGIGKKEFSVANCVRAFLGVD